ncbi:MAG: ectoine synthase [Deltaproteobacteria bacterium]|nr:ectoine synthase [Deltaproteobacteria bacterium]
MIVRHLADLARAGRVIDAPTWSSRRLLLAHDHMGFSLHDTIIHAGTRTPMWYRNHLEAVYCVEGRGYVELAETGERWDVAPGTVYALDKHDRHVLVAETELRLVCVFDPPVVGPENHDEHGGYELLDPASGPPAPPSAPPRAEVTDEAPPTPRATAADDPYASRTGDPAGVAPRPDPSVWDRAAKGPLTAAQVERYDRDGFIVLERVLDEEAVAHLRRDLDARVAAADVSAPTVVAEPGSDIIRSIFDVHRGAGALGLLAEHPTLTGAARQLLASDVYIHQSRANVKPGLDGREFQWHSDFETWHVEDGMPRPRALTAAVMLTDNTPWNGPLLVVQGSHARYVRCPGRTPDAHYLTSLRAQRYGTPPKEALAELIDAGGGIAQATGPAGSVILFDSNALHASGGNLDTRPRANVFIVYNSVENRLVDPFGGLAPRPPFLAERDPVPALGR